MKPIPKIINDRHGISYDVVFKPPTEFNYIARLEVRNAENTLVAEMQFGERDPGCFYLDDLQVYDRTGHGIGSRLLGIAETYARVHGFSDVHGVIIAYAPASADCSFLKKWYEKRGYFVRFIDGHPRKEYCGHISKKLNVIESTT